MKAKFLIKLIVPALIAACGLSALAQDRSGTNADEKSGRMTADAQAVARLELAYSSARYGRENRDADAMILAAKILKENPAEKLTVQKTTEGGTTDEGTKPPAPDQTVAAFLADARRFAKGNKNILARIAEVEKFAIKGAIGGARRSIEQIKAGGSDVMKIEFKGGETGIVLVSGDGSTDLDLYIYDENGKLVASDTDGMDSCAVRFSPKWTGTFQVRVKNLGKVYNRYAIVTN